MLRDRVALLETALQEQGVNVKSGIDRAARTPERISAMQQDRTAFFERFLRVLGDQG